MSNLPVNHNTIYFDNLYRAHKADVVLSLIHSTYQAKRYCREGNVRAEIAQRFLYAIKLFKEDSGTYRGTADEFESKYTIGHELCIWKNSALDLAPLAIKVAENEITIRDYFDIIFLNYFQPVNNNTVHILYSVLKFMSENQLDRISKEQMGNVYMAVGHSTEPGNVNGAYNMLVETSYFISERINSDDYLKYNGNCSIEELMARCDTTYVERGYDAAREELRAEEAYVQYVTNEHRSLLANNDNEINLSAEQLANELRRLYGQYGAVGIHLFGVRRGEFARRNHIRLADLCILAGISENYKYEIQKGRRLAQFVAERNPEDEIVVEPDLEDDVPEDNEDNADIESEDNTEAVEIRHVDYFDFISGGYNAIYYGTPGCGKSFHVENELLKDVGVKFKFRTTFYQEYTHTDFVGQLLPIVVKRINNGIEEDYVKYSFIPGPFTLALETAYRNPNTMVYLVIEEINRGHAASILGDIFQLLDRAKEGNEKYPVGQSEYSIDKVDLANYLKDEKGIILPDNRIFIPSNMCLIGTMNTNDQNVSALDTAFKRRWKMEKIKNDFKDDHPYASKFVPGTDVTWRIFVEQINKKIVNDESIGINAEDKQIGPFFMEAYDLDYEQRIDNKDRKRAFAYKMMEYLWSNVAKYERGNWFKNNPKTLDELVDDYVENGLNVFKGDIFADDSEENVSMYPDNGEEE